MNIEIVPTGGKFHVVMNGATIHKAGNMAAAQITVERERKKHSNLVVIQDGVHVDSNGHSVEHVEEYDINERFEFLEMLVEMVAKGDSLALTVVGQGGLGKSWTVFETLEKCGLQNFDNLVAMRVAEAEAASDEKSLEGIDLSDASMGVSKFGTYKLIKGHSSPKGLYRILWENHGGVLVFDDCDSIQKDMTSLNLLKAALDTTGERRIISWASESPIDDGLPRSFEFQGRVIFISNLRASAWDTAVKSRSNMVDVHMNRRQIVERLQTISKSPKFHPDISAEAKDAAMAIIDREQERVKDLNFRTLVKAAKAYAAAPAERAEKLVTYLITN